MLLTSLNACTVKESVYTGTRPSTMRRATERNASLFLPREHVVGRDTAGGCGNAMGLVSL